MVEKKERLIKSSGVFFILRDRNAILTEIRVREKPFFDAKFVFPGGKVNLGETIRQAVVREIQEECGLNVRKITSLGQEIFDHPKAGLVCSEVFLADVVNRKVKNIEPETGVHFWLPISQVRNLIHPYHLPIVDKLDAYLASPQI